MDFFESRTLTCTVCDRTFTTHHALHVTRLDCPGCGHPNEFCTPEPPPPQKRWGSTSADGWKDDEGG